MQKTFQNTAFQTTWKSSEFEEVEGVADASGIEGGARMDLVWRCGQAEGATERGADCVTGGTRE